jgi:hypothetical protein
MLFKQFKLRSDSVDFESLSEVLKSPIRRKIVLFLSSKESVSYVDLMNAVEITNTGKFNYHLKVLCDLIEKDEEGKYCLSEKGLLAVQFLQTFDNSKSGETVFETRAFSLFAGFMWLLLVYPFLGLLFGWYLYFTDLTVAYRGDLAIPLITFSIIMVPAFVLFSINQFPTIEIDRDSIVVKWATGRRFFTFEEAKMDVRGHILRLGGDLMAFGHFIPFREKECVSLLSKQVKTYHSKPLYIAHIMPPLFLTVLFALAPQLEGLFSPELWAILFGATTAISLAMFAYGFPVDIRLGNLRRGISVVIYSVFVGVIIAISTLLAML